MAGALPTLANWRNDSGISCNEIRFSDEVLMICVCTSVNEAQDIVRPAVLNLRTAKPGRFERRPERLEDLRHFTWMT